MNRPTPRAVGIIKIREAIFSGLSFLSYIRMMGLLVCLGLAVGMVYYTYSRAVYQSRAIVHFSSANLPFNSGGQPWQIQQTLDNVLNSRYMVERTALHLGITKQLGNYETLRDEYVPKLEVRIVDGSTITIDVFAYNNQLTKTWQPALVQEYAEYNKKNAKEWRERYVQVYKDELSALKERIDQQDQAKYSFEEDNAITELFIQQSGLTQVPKDMILARHQMDTMNRVQEKLGDPHLEVVEKLSILSTLDHDLKMQVGNVVSSGDIKPAVPGTLENLVPVTDDPKETVVVLPSMVNSLETWQELDKQERKLKAEMQDLQTKGRLPGHPEVKAVALELSKVTEALQRELKTKLERFQLEYAGLTEKLKGLEKQLPDYREVTKKYQSFRQQYALQQKGQLAWDQAYADVAKQVASAEFQGDKQPIDLDFLGFTLQRDDPVSPPKMKMLMVSLALGIGLAFGVPFAMEKLNDTICRLEDAETALDTAALGVVPYYHVSELEEMTRGSEEDAEKPDRLYENFRLIRASIALNRDRAMPSQAIMISSARPKEGKTTVALNLAWAFASMGEKTLLLDCDLRRGRMHKAAKLNNEKGLSNVLKDNVGWESVVQTTTIPNLDIITRGPIRNGATEGLCRPEFTEMVTEWRKTYARIILDTPPLLGLSEPSSLQRVVDGLVLVILAESTPTKDAKQALDLVAKSGGRLFGFILNRLDLKKAKNYYNYYYYSPYYYDALE